jgi:hypothetical protein
MFPLFVPLRVAEHAAMEAPASFATSFNVALMFPFVLFDEAFHQQYIRKTKNGEKV